MIVTQWGTTMPRYQLIYNGNPTYPLCDTRDEAEGFKQKAAAKWPEITVEIKQVKEQADD